MKIDGIKISRLVNRAKSGDGKAYVQLYQSTYQKLYYLSLAIVGDEDIALDVVSESYLRIVQSLNELEDGGLFLAWCSRIIYNIGLEYLEREKKKQEDQTDPMLFAYESDINPIAIGVKDDRDRIMIEIMCDMDPILRVTLILRHLFKFQEEEIALVMDIMPETAVSRLKAAMDIIVKASTARGSGFIAGYISLISISRALVQSATTVSMRAEAAFSILKDSLSEGGYRKAGKFSVVKSAASVVEVDRDRMTMWGLLGILAIVMGIGTSTTMAPRFNRIELPDSYVGPPCEIDVELGFDSNLSQFYAESESGSRYSAVDKKGEYSIFVPNNGIYTLYAINENQKKAVAEVKVDKIDTDKPYLVDYQYKDELLEVYFADDLAGVRYDKIYGQTELGTWIYPEYYEEETGKIVFHYNKANFVLYVPDYAGNISKNSVMVIKQ